MNSRLALWSGRYVKNEEDRPHPDWKLGRPQFQGHQKAMWSKGHSLAFSIPARPVLTDQGSLLGDRKAENRVVEAW